MTARKLLYLCETQLIAFHWRNGMLSKAYDFADTEEGKKEFTDYLFSHKNEIYSLLINLTEEDFIVDKIPFLRGADRKSIIHRKLEKSFFNAPLKTSISLGIEKKQRKNELVLFAALSGKNKLSPWLDIIRQTGIAISGIHSLPLLVPALCKKMKINTARCLFLSIQDQSIRQSHLENGKLHFSRLTRLFDSNIESIAQAISTEGRNLYHYLASQRLITRNKPMTVYILANHDAVETISKHCINDESMEYVILDSFSCAQRCGLKTMPGNIRSEAIFLSLMCHSTAAQFATETIRHHFFLKRFQQALHVFSGSFFALCLLAAGWQFNETGSIDDETRRLTNEKDIIQRHHDNILHELPPLPTDKETLSFIIDRYTELERQNKSPLPLYGEISRALQNSPAIELESIEWQNSNKKTPAGFNPSKENQSSEESGNETAIVNGIIVHGDQNDPRQIINTFVKFTNALKGNPALRVEILKQAFDIESGKALKDEDTIIDGEKPLAFSIKITRRNGP